MAIAWKTSNVEGHKIVHWAKHDPSAILRAIETSAVERHGNGPEVAVHSFSSRLRLAVRTVPNESFYGALFENLVATNALGVPFVETPVALVSKGGSHRIVTRWKSGTRELSAFLRDRSVSAGLKKRACTTLVRKVAALASRGFQYAEDELALSNGLADKHGTGYLVDLMHLNPYKPAPERPSEDNLAQIRGLARSLSHSFQDGDPARRFVAELVQEYASAYGALVKPSKK